MEQQEKEEKNNGFKEHLNTAAIIITIIASILGSMIWMNGKFNDLEKDIVMMKTVMIMKNIMPSELAKCEKEKS